jgi:hypothetical protein
MWRADVTHDNGRHCEFRPGIRPGPNSPYIRDREWAAKTAPLSACILRDILERAKGFEPSTPTLAG